MDKGFIKPMDFNDIGEKRQSKYPKENGHIYYFDTWEVAQSWLRGDRRKAISEEAKTLRAQERERRKREKEEQLKRTKQ